MFTVRTAHLIGPWDPCQKSEALSSFIVWEKHQSSSVQSLSRVWLFATPWTTAHQASLSITNSHPNPCPLSGWCHPIISSSVAPFSSCPQSSPASGSFQMSQLFTLSLLLNNLNNSTSYHLFTAHSPKSLCPWPTPAPRFPKVRNTLLILWWYFLCARWCFKGSDYIISLNSLQNPQRIIVMLRWGNGSSEMLHDPPKATQPGGHKSWDSKPLTICTIYV